MGRINFAVLLIMATKTFTFAEIKKHDKDEDCWMAINGNVYDITKFLNEHPGGSEVIMEVAGQDGTEGFEDVGHSEDARDMLKEYLIGELPEEEKEKAKAAMKERAEASGGGSNMMLVVLAGLAVGAALYFKSQGEEEQA